MQEKLVSIWLATFLYITPNYFLSKVFDSMDENGNNNKKRPQMYKLTVNKTI